MSSGQDATSVTDEHHTTEAETEDDTDCDTSTEVTEDEQHAADGPTGKKKKKKKKKKKPSNSAGTATVTNGEHAGSSTEKLSAAEKQEADRRFQKALESARQGEDMWVLLGGANIHDQKIKKLFDALRNNSSITSVNLSSNHISDEGVQALVDILEQGGCSELISLDLRGNSLSVEAESLLASLGKTRKQLDIATGPLPSPETEQSSSSASTHHKPGRGRGRAGAIALAQQQRQQQQQQQQQPGLSDISIQDLARTSPMFRKYFQTGEEEEAEGSSGDEEGEQVEQLPPPEEVWAQVEELLPLGSPAIPQLSAALVIISRALDSEMSSMPAHEEECQLADFQPHFKEVVHHLQHLQQVLQLQPPPQVHQSSSNTPQPAVGSHRVWACNILHMLLLHNNPAIDKAVADAGLLPLVVAIALQYGHCSAVQCRAVEMLRSSLRSSVLELWQGLFTPGYGQQLQQSGSTDLLPPLHTSLVELAEAALQTTMGMRPCSTGFVIELANTLLQGSDTAQSDQGCPALCGVLESCAVWQSSVAVDGAIHQLLQEQDGQLCGPPPPRPVPSLDSMDEEVLDPLGGLMMNGQLFALLNHINDSSAGA